jgi:WD40 repeat protein/DNA-directed RNA polymerase subunit M/transcription elongation factor TFIIS
MSQKPIVLSCPNCGSNMHPYTDQYGDKQAKCPACGTRMDLPDNAPPQQQTFQADHMNQLVNAALQSAAQQLSTPQATQAKQSSNSCCGCIFALILIITIFGVVGVSMYSTIPDSAIADFENAIGINIFNNARTLNTSQPLSHPEEVTVIAYSPDGRILAVGGDNGMLEFWNPTTLESVRSVSITTANAGIREVQAMAFSPDGRTLAVAAGNDRIQLVEAESGRNVGNITQDMSSVNAMAFTADGTQLMWLDTVRNLFVADVEMRQVTNQFGLPGYTTDFVIGPDGDFVAAVIQNEGIRFWDPATGELLRTISTSVTQTQIAISPDGELIAISNSDTVQLWDTDTLKQVDTLRTKFTVFSIQAIEFSPTGKYVAAGSFFSNGAIWDVDSGDLEVTLEDIAEIKRLSFSADGQTLATSGGTYFSSGSGEGNLVRLWDVFDVEDADNSLPD